MNLKNRVKALIEFQTKFKGLKNDSFTKLTDNQVELRINMYDEEAEEFLKANRMKDKVEEYDAILDEIFLTIGDSISWGVYSKLKIHNPTFTKVSPKTMTLFSLMKADDLRKNTEEDVVRSCNDRLDYIRNKAFKLYGAKFEEILEKGMEVVESSNMSKLGDDGEPIYNTVDSEFYDKNKPLGKILKNPKTYFEPTAKLKVILDEYGV